jgi:hypothetical protein
MIYDEPKFTVYAILVLTLYKLLDKVGKGIALREMIGFYSVLIYLVAPLVGYDFYTYASPIARLWVRYMPVSSERYFDFVLPAIIFFLIGLFFPSFKQAGEIDEAGNVKSILSSAQFVLEKNKKLWMPVLLLGGIGFALKNIGSLSSLQFFLTFFYLMLFAGFLYVYFSPSFKYKGLLLGAISIAILMEAVQSGMFTVVVYMGVILGSIIFVGLRISMVKKLIYFFLAMFMVVTLQSTKGVFRKQTWNKDFAGSKLETFATLMYQNAVNSEKLFDPNAFFPLYSRMNQGYNVALVMRRIPAVQPFDDGHSIYMTVLSAILPRFLWADKMKSGGFYNMKHFAGWEVYGWSTNIGPVGEAYGNFGEAGGIIYMFIFGLFIKFVFFTVLKKSKQIPLLLFWLPVFFYELSFSMENDTLQALNSIIKVSAFAYFIYLSVPKLLGARQKLLDRQRKQFEVSSRTSLPSQA